MKENLTVSLEMAKKLKEAGWVKPTYFQWVQRPVALLSNPPQESWDLYDETQMSDYTNGREVAVVNAPIFQEVISELPNYLPKEFHGKSHKLVITVDDGDNAFYIEYIPMIPIANTCVLEYEEPLIVFAPGPDYGINNVAEAWLWCKAEEFID